MKNKDLIEALSQFPGDARVCVEVCGECFDAFGGDDIAANFTVESVERENDSRHGIKITLEP